MRFWDASAIIPLLIDEATTAVMHAAFIDDTEMSVWWATSVECASALARKRHTGGIPAPVMEAAHLRLAAFQHVWTEVQPAPSLRENAMRLLQSHDLRAADALQLSAALVAAEGAPHTLDFVCLDTRLSRAAQREGFRITSGNPASRT